MWASILLVLLVEIFAQPGRRRKGYFAVRGPLDMARPRLSLPGYMGAANRSAEERRRGCSLS